MTPAIKAEALTKSFGSLTAVDRLTLEVPEGELFGLVGPDGAGKSTTMRLMTGILEPTGGDAWVAGYNIRTEAETIKENIGYMSQRFGLYPDLTVSENIDFYADIYGVPRGARKEAVERLLEFSKLGPFKRRYAGNLSGGMKQKLGLVCALIHTPKVLFLDEPTCGVDPVSRREFWRIIYQLLRQNVTIFVSTAYLDEAERCNRVGLLHRGRLLACAGPEEVKKLMRAAIVEIRTARARDASKILQRELGTGKVGLFGDRVHVTTDDPQATGERIRELLGRVRISIIEMRQVPPTLEDIFISVLEEKT